MRTAKYQNTSTAMNRPGVSTSRRSRVHTLASQTRAPAVWRERAGDQVEEGAVSTREIETVADQADPLDALETQAAGAEDERGQKDCRSPRKPGQERRHLPDPDHLSPLGDRVATSVRDNDECPFQAEIAHRMVKPPAEPRGRAALDLDPPQAPGPGQLQDEIHLGTGRRPIEARPGHCRSSREKVLDHEPLPACTEHRMSAEDLEVADPEERVHDAAVANIDLRRLDKPFLQVRCEWREPTDQEQAAQCVDVTRHGRRADRQAPRQ